MNNKSQQASYDAFLFSSGTVTSRARVSFKQETSFAYKIKMAAKLTIYNRADFANGVSNNTIDVILG